MVAGPQRAVQALGSLGDYGLTVLTIYKRNPIKRKDDIRQVIAICSSLLICATTAMAQDLKRFEAGVFFGGTSSEGIGINPVNTGGGRVVDTLNPKSGFSWGFDVNYNLSENFSVGFLWDRQTSKLNGDFVGGGSQDFADLHLYNYHGVFTYNFSSRKPRYGHMSLAALAQPYTVLPLLAIFTLMVRRGFRPPGVAA